jgi:hypothetical protein
MSAFLSYSNSQRRQVKQENPEIGNADVSRILAKMWREAPEEERKIHIYNNAIAAWRKNADQEVMAVRKKREDIALQILDAPGKQQYKAAPTAATSLDSLVDNHPQPQNMSSNVQQPAEQDVLNYKGQSKSPSEVARVPAKAMHPHGAHSYGMGYAPVIAEDNDNSGKLQAPGGRMSQYGNFRGRAARNVPVGPSGELSGPYGMRMPVNAHSAEAIGSAEYGAPRNGCGEPTGLS